MDFDDESSPYARPRAAGGAGDARPWLFATAGAAALGALFAGLSTADFIEHLDRQVHSIHCSFIPGAGQALGESGCRTVMLSPYSSLFRESMWGGLPISLLALAVFAYLVFRGLDFALREDTSQRETRFLLAAVMLPVLMSVIYGVIAAVKIGAVCKLCVGVYLASSALLVFAFIANSKAPPAGAMDTSGTVYAGWFGQGVLFVAVMAGLYVAMAPVSTKSADGCGALVKSDDPAGIMIPIGGSTTGRPSIAVLDPLCPACKSFDDRLEASGLGSRLNLKTVLFPLDSTCNWMVKESLHPGACAVSEAILCQRESAREIMAYAFEHQAELRDLAKKSGDKAVQEALVTRFPAVKGCIGGPGVKNKLNKSLRWAVANALPVLTPQLFVGDRRVCDEDTDLGLEYTVAAMLAKGGK